LLIILSLEVEFIKLKKDPWLKKMPGKNWGREVEFHYCQIFQKGLKFVYLLKGGKK